MMQNFHLLNSLCMLYVPLTGFFGILITNISNLRPLEFVKISWIYARPFIISLPHIAVRWVAFILHISDILVSNLASKTCCSEFQSPQPNSWIVPQIKAKTTSFFTFPVRHSLTTLPLDTLCKSNLLRASLNKL
jgi:hypothetical protein